MHPSLSLGGRHSLNPVDSAFILHDAIHSVSGNVDANLLVASGCSGAGGCHFKSPTFALGEFLGTSGRDLRQTMRPHLLLCRLLSPRRHSSHPQGLPERAASLSLAQLQATSSLPPQVPHGHCLQFCILFRRNQLLGLGYGRQQTLIVSRGG